MVMLIGSKIKSWDAFEEVDMENISPTIQLNILVKLAVKKRNLLGSSYNLEGVVSYKNIFQ